MKALSRQTLLALIFVGVTSVSCSSASNAPESDIQVIKVDGSSTVYPITNAIQEAFQVEKPQGATIDVAFSGTGGGFEKFCAGETVINDASRPISEVEMTACRNADIRYYELPVGFDALTVVVNSENTWADDITLDELQMIWAAESQGQVTRWNDIRASWPDRPIALYGPGADSGTYDYFTEVVIGEGAESRSDYIASEDDALLVDRVSQDPNSLGYFGFAYYEENAAVLKALAVDGGEGPIQPSRQTVEQAEYQPLSRPLFIYVNAQAAQESPALQTFVRFYLDNAPTFVESVGYVPLPQEGYEVAITQFYRGKVGTVFDGRVQPGLTIQELLSKRATF